MCGCTPGDGESIYVWGCQPCDSAVMLAARVNYLRKWPPEVQGLRNLGDLWPGAQAIDFVTRLIRTRNPVPCPMLTSYDFKSTARSESSKNHCHLHGVDGAALYLFLPCGFA